MSDGARLELEEERHYSSLSHAYNGNQGLREKLGAQLRKIRKAHGSTLLRFGEDSGVHFNRLSKIERGVLLPHDDELTAILRTGAASQEIEDDVRQLARTLREELVLWDLPDPSLPPSPASSQDQIRNLLGSMSHLRLFCSNTVPGPLQTHEYAAYNFAAYREAMPNNRTTLELVQIAKSAVREQLYMHDKRFEIVVHESIFLVTPAPPEMMSDQAERIAQLSFLPRVDLRVIPSGTRMRSAARHDFILGDNKILNIDLAIGKIGIRAPHTIHLYAELFSTLQRDALQGDEARDYFRRIATRLRQRSKPSDDTPVVSP